VEERKEIEHSLRASEQVVKQLNVELEQRVKERTMQLEVANQELEAFSYSVSHDLRSPLRAIDGFSLAVLEDHGDQIGDSGKNYLQRIRAGAQRMGQLIDDMLKLSRVSRSTMKIQPTNLSELAEQCFRECQDAEPARNARISVTSGLFASCDHHLIKIALDNLIGNAWKYSSRKNDTCIEFGMRQNHDKHAFFVQDNGVGFDMQYANKLFGAFQRLHTVGEFPGTGIGLATVKRVISRHGGEIWAEAEPGRGATFYFTLPTQQTVANAPEPGGSDDEQQADFAGGRQSG
jgi:light-regulated signal transduction histidine kinase (bacteriophytochrome)